MNHFKQLPTTEQSGSVNIPLPFCEIASKDIVTPHDVVERGIKETNYSNPFYLYFHGRLNDDGIIEMTHNEQRTLTGNWGVALSQIDFKQTQTIAVKSEEIPMLILSQAHHKKSYDYFLSTAMANRAVVVEQAKNDYFENFPHASIIIPQKLSGESAKTPEGRFTFEDWRDIVVYEMNEAMNGISMNLNLDRRCDSDLRIVNSWNYAKISPNISPRSVIVFPIFKMKTRKLLGIPELDTPEFKAMINKLIDTKDSVFGFGNFNLVRRNLAVECSIVEHNGTAEKGHLCYRNDDPEGHLLRNIRQEPNILFGHRLFIEYNNEDRLYMPVCTSVNKDEPFTLSRVRIRLLSSDSRHPICCDGPVNLLLHFVPEPEFMRTLQSSSQNHGHESVKSIYLKFSNNYVDVDSSNFDITLSGKIKE